MSYTHENKTTSSVHSSAYSENISWIENKKEILEGLRLFSENLETLWL